MLPTTKGHKAVLRISTKASNAVWQRAGFFKYDENSDIRCVLASCRGNIWVCC